MDIKKLNYFIHVAELGSFTRASIALGIEQSTLSRHIRALEQELGIPLFHRDGRGVNMTIAGESLLARSRRIMAELSMLTHDLAMLSEEPTGKIKIGIPPSVAALLIARVIRDFAARFPRMTLDVVEMPTGVLYEWLSSGRLDLAMLYLVPATRGVVAEVLFTEDLLLVVSPAIAGRIPFEVTVTDLVDIELALPGTDHGLRTVVEGAARKVDVELRCTFHANSMPTLKSLVQEGLSSTILPVSAVRSELATGELVGRRFKAPTLERTVLLATGTQITRTEPLRELCAIIRSNVENVASEFEWRLNAK